MNGAYVLGTQWYAVEDDFFRPFIIGERLVSYEHAPLVRFADEDDFAEASRDELRAPG